MHRHNIDFNYYVDDMKLHVQIKPGTTSVSSIISCLDEIKYWMSSNSLQLNDSKSEVIEITSPSPRTNSINNLSASLGVLSNKVKKKKEASTLGIIFH